MSRLIDRSGRPTSGTVPNGVVAIVTDNVDPDELGRIQVEYPTLDGVPKSFWLRVASQNAGKERGMYSLPEIGDEVLVMFMQGSQDVGIIIAQFWNGIDKPPTEAKDGMPGPDKTELKDGQWSTDTFEAGSDNIEKNDRRFWRSRSGHLIVFDDTEDEETIQIWDGSHTLALVLDTKNSRIILSNSEGDIHIRSQQDIYMESGRDIKMYAGRHIERECVENTIHKAGKNIEVESGKDTSFVAKKNWSADADVDWSASAGANVKMEASAEATYKSGSTMTIKSGYVFIN